MNTYEVFELMQRILRRYTDWSEETITDYFLSVLSENNDRIKYKKFTKCAENKNGADWEWWLLTKDVLIKFYVQAKKADGKIKKKAILYRTNKEDSFQIDKLIESGQRENALPLYAFYSGNVLPTKCSYAAQKDCYKAVYLASAVELKDNIEKLNDTKLLNPMSCLFKMSKCIKDSNLICVCCQDCGRQTYCDIINDDGDDNQCVVKMAALLEKFYFQALGEENRGFYEVLPEHIVIFHYANSVLRVEKLKDKFFEEYSYAIQVSNIVITDYIDRHSKNHVEAMIGANQIVIDDRVFHKEEIISILCELLKKYKVIKNIGLFGSYAKNTANESSDIDLMLVYDLSKIKTNGFKPIFEFLKETIQRFAKPVDFVDYEYCDEDFRDEVWEDIIWVGTENKTTNFTG